MKPILIFNLFFILIGFYCNAQTKYEFSRADSLSLKILQNGFCNCLDSLSKSNTFNLDNRREKWSKQIYYCDFKILSPIGYKFQELEKIFFKKKPTSLMSEIDWEIHDLVIKENLKSCTNLFISIPIDTNEILSFLKSKDKFVYNEIASRKSKIEYEIIQRIIRNEIDELAYSFDSNNVFVKNKDKLIKLGVLLQGEGNIAAKFESKIINKNAIEERQIAFAITNYNEGDKKLNIRQLAEIKIGFKADDIFSKIQYIEFILPSKMSTKGNIPPPPIKN